MDEKDSLIAFGQYYLRLDKCHLGRLVVNPANRGEGVAAKLLQELCEHGMKKFEVNSCSWFVLAHNEEALKAYEKFGFCMKQYPEPLPLENCFYMVK